MNRFFVHVYGRTLDDTTIVLLPSKEEWANWQYWKQYLEKIKVAKPSNPDSEKVKKQRRDREWWVTNSTERGENTNSGVWQLFHAGATSSKISHIHGNHQPVYSCGVSFPLPPPLPASFCRKDAAIHRDGWVPIVEAAPPILTRVLLGFVPHAKMQMYLYDLSLPG